MKEIYRREIRFSLVRHRFRQYSFFPDCSQVKRFLLGFYNPLCEFRFSPTKSNIQLKCLSFVGAAISPSAI